MPALMPNGTILGGLLVSPEILETAYLCSFSDDVVLGGP